MMRCAFLMLGVLLAGSARAGENVWTATGPEGGQALAFAISSGAAPVVYAATVGGIFRSADLGATWRGGGIGLQPSSTLAVAVDPGNADIAYAGTEGGGVFRTSDGGETWTPANGRDVELATASIAAIAVDPGDRRLLYAATQGVGLFRSTSGGDAWQRSDSGITTAFLLALAIDPRQPRTLYVGTVDGVFRSVDGGDAWEAASDGLTDTFVRGLAVDESGVVYAATPGGVFGSADGGDSWHPASTGLESPSTFALAIDGHAPRRLYAATAAGVFRSPVAEVSWTPARDGFGDGTGVEALAAAPGVAGALLAGPSDGSGPWRTTNGGDRWVKAARGFANTIVRALAIDPQQPARIYAGLFGRGVARSDDGAVGWQDASAGLDVADVAALAVAPSRPAVVYAGSAGAGAYRSDDAGGLWMPAAGGLDGFVRALAADPGDADRVIAGTQGGLFRTPDGGAHWSPLTAGIGAPRIDALARAPSDPLRLYAAAAGTVYRSDDGGDGWTQAAAGLPGDVPVQALAVDPTDAAIAYAGTGSAGIFATGDAGASWRASSGVAGGQVSGAAITALAVDAGDPRTIWAAGSLGALLSRDGGDVWVGVNRGLTVRATTAVAIDPADGRNVYVGTAGGGVFALRLTAQHCGDGTVDDGEACDAGAANGAPGACCGIDCTFRAAGTSCRESRGECDIADACSGESGTCPDVVVDNGTACSDDDACSDGDACRDGLCRAGPPRLCDACQRCDASFGCLGAVCTATPTPVDTGTPTDTPLAPRCAGDCDADGAVAINELIRGVAIALGNGALDECPVFDGDGDGAVGISELVRAVNAALAGCGVSA